MLNFNNLKNFCLQTQTFERFINACIQTDEDALSELKKIANKCLKISTTLFGGTVDYYIFFYQQHIEIITAINSPTNMPPTTDASITGNPEGFICLLVTKNHFLTQEQGLVFVDNAEILPTVQRLFFQLDIDWEEHLSSITGDFIAYNFCKFAKTSATAIANTSRNFAEILQEFVIEECRLSPSTAEIYEFSNDVSELKSYLSRLEARYARINQTLGYK